MLLPEHVTALKWRSLMMALDRRIDHAVRSHCRQRRLSYDDLARGYTQLGHLRNGGEPDYDMPGVAAAYGLTYMPRRAASVLASLLSIGAVRPPRRVLDVGSGTGATALALELWCPVGPLEIAAVEPSKEMRELAAVFKFRENMSVKIIPGDLSSIVDTAQMWSPGGYDLLIMSACLPYKFSMPDMIARSLKELSAREAVIVAIEPEAKEEELILLGHSLRRLNLNPAIDCCHDLPGFVRSSVELPILTSFVNDHWPQLRYNKHTTENALEVLGRYKAMTITSWNSVRRELRLTCSNQRNKPPIYQYQSGDIKAMKVIVSKDISDIGVKANRHGYDINIVVNKTTYIRIETVDGVIIFNGVVERDKTLRGASRDGRPVRVTAIENGAILATAIIS